MNEERLSKNQLQISATAFYGVKMLRRLYQLAGILQIQLNKKITKFPLFYCVADTVTRKSSSGEFMDLFVACADAFFSTSQEIGWKDRLRNDLFCDDRA